LYRRIATELMLSQKGTIHFYKHNTSYRLAKSSLLKDFISRQVAKAGRKISALSIIFCDDAHLRSINKEFLKHDYNTDIITFDLSSSDDEVSGEIYISIDTVKENASYYQVAVSTELKRVIFHGLLHLLGYDDNSKADKIRMREMEDAWLGKWKKVSGEG
jgi:probable rRNA maturation factor